MVSTRMSEPIVNRVGAVPFRLRRSDDAIGGGGITSTEETIYGLVRFVGDAVQLQWRVERKIDRIGPEIRTDREIGEVREVTIPLARLAAARVQRSLWAFWRRPKVVLTGADLTAFEAIAGEQGLALDHPGQIELPLRRSDRLAGEALCAELNLGVADLALAQAEALDALPPANPGDSESS